MILAVDAGNTSTAFGFYDDNKLVCAFRGFTKPYRSVDEYGMLLEGVCERNNIDISSIDGAVISSVVPPVTEQIRSAIINTFGVKPLTVGHGIKTGVNIRIDNHSQLGSDIVANVAAAAEILQAPFAVVDLGTATTVAAVNGAGELTGVVIMPGARLAIDALADYAAELPHISLTEPKAILGKNTEDSMLSGCVYGTACAIDGILEKLKNGFSANKLSVAACGGLADKIIPFCKTEIPIYQNLTLDGLCRIYSLNKREEKRKVKNKKFKPNLIN